MREGFLRWFYRDAIKRIVAVWFNVTRATYETFSVDFLLKTLFYPWKRDIVAPVEPSLQTLLQALSFNLISRLVGFVVRSAAIFTGVVITSIVFILGLLATSYLLLAPWHLLPTYRYLKKEVKPLELEPLEKIVQYPESVFVLRHLGLDPAVVAAASAQTFVDADALKKTALHFSQILGQGGAHATPSHLLLGYFELAPSLHGLLVNHDATIEEMAEVAAWEHRSSRHLAKPPLFAAPEKIKTTLHIGYDWAAGYTPHLNRFAHHITSPPNMEEYLTHREVVDQAITILSRLGKHNALLLGNPGVGRATVVRAIARVLGDARKIFSLDVNLALAGLNLSDDFESRFVGILNDVIHAGDVTLYIEDIERLLIQDRAGTLNASAILTPYLASPAFSLIATTTFTSYHELIEASPELATNFERIDVVEPKPREVMRILEDLVPLFEERQKVIITYQAIREIVRAAERFIVERRFPEKAIDVLDEVLTGAGANRIITARDVDEVISAKTHGPVGSPLAKERELLLNLEVVLHQRLINQDQAVAAIAQALRRARAGVSPENKPIGSFLFLGPTGVGKTETAKTLAEAYFGTDQAVTRFDMSEYQTSGAANRLVENIAQAMSQRPFTVLLLDEIEKAYSELLNLFLTVLDEAKMTSLAGQTINFNNAMIIATSNAGSEFIREAGSRGQTLASSELLDYVQKQGIFKPEFLNRFTAVVAFQPLTIDHLVKIVDIIAARINKLLIRQQVKVELNPQAKAKIAQLGFDPVFGARALERTMREKVENIIATRILNDQLQKGQTLLVTEAMI